MVKVLHLSDIHLGSGFSHGHINPETGLNTRLEDFVGALRRCIDRALDEPVDLVLFGGDAFPDATPPPYIQELFAQQFRRLVDGGIPTVLLVGNHDQHRQGQGGASLCIYRTLGVPGFVVGDTLHTYTLPTRSGPVQVMTLPWLTPSALVTRPELEGLSLREVNQQLLDRLRLALEGEIRQLDPDLPHILLAHAMLDTAQYGSERFLAVGKGFNLPLSLVARSELDYVALGHVHRHQVLCTDPPVVYAGSLERVDFSEEPEEKGFVLAQVERGQTRIEFVPLPARPFKTLRWDMSHSEHPQDDLLTALAQVPLDGAIVRLLYTIQPQQMAQIDDSALHQALAPSHSYSIQAEFVSQLATPRVPELAEGHHLNPLEALATYLDRRDDLAPLKPDLLKAAADLMAEVELPQAWTTVDEMELDTQGQGTGARDQPGAAIDPLHGASLTTATSEPSPHPEQLQFL